MENMMDMMEIKVLRNMMENMWHKTPWIRTKGINFLCCDSCDKYVTRAMEICDQSYGMMEICWIFLIDVTRAMEICDQSYGKYDGHDGN